MLTEQVEAMQSPVQRLRHNYGPHANVPMDLQMVVTDFIGLLPPLPWWIRIYPEGLLSSVTSLSNKITGGCFAGAYQFAVIVEKAHSLSNMKEPHSNVFLPAQNSSMLVSACSTTVRQIVL